MSKELVETREKRGKCIFFFQAGDGIRDLVRSRGLGDVYKRQLLYVPFNAPHYPMHAPARYLDRFPTLPLSLIHI